MRDLPCWAGDLWVKARCCVFTYCIVWVCHWWPASLWPFTSGEFAVTAVSPVRYRTVRADNNVYQRLYQCFYRAILPDHCCGYFAVRFSQISNEVLYEQVRADRLLGDVPFSRAQRYRP